MLYSFINGGVGAAFGDTTNGINSIRIHGDLTDHYWVIATTNYSIYLTVNGTTGLMIVSLYGAYWHNNNRGGISCTNTSHNGLSVYTATLCYSYE
ncbi:MAG: hypothetical protein IJ193_08035 [Bacilli bacterium]|nr:hypothetical protein [Bacilli bacterium]